MTFAPVERLLQPLLEPRAQLGNDGPLLHEDGRHMLPHPPLQLDERGPIAVQPAGSIGGRSGRYSVRRRAISDNSRDRASARNASSARVIRRTSSFTTICGGVPSTKGVL